MSSPITAARCERRVRFFMSDTGLRVVCRLTSASDYIVLLTGGFRYLDIHQTTSIDFDENFRRY